MNSSIKLVAVAASALLVAACTPPDDGTAIETEAAAPDMEAAGPPTELVIQTLSQGHGQAIMSGETAVVHYTGWLYDEDAHENKGAQFDSSRPTGRALRFQLGEGRVIQGWEMGVDGMLIGETRRLIIPSDLGYGDRGAGEGVIPPGATLVFDVELIDIE